MRRFFAGLLQVAIALFAILVPAILSVWLEDQGFSPEGRRGRVQHDIGTARHPAQAGQAGGSRSRGHPPAGGIHTIAPTLHCPEEGGIQSVARSDRADRVHAGRDYLMHTAFFREHTSRGAWC